MRTDDVRGDDSIMEDRRGRGGGMGMGGFPLPIGRGGKLGIPALLMMAVAFFLTRGGGGGGIDTGDIYNQMNSGSQQAAPDTDAQYEFVKDVGTLLQDFWSNEFEAAGDEYREAQVVVFDAPTSTGCGVGSPETGPFYCPPDDKVYIDLGFYRQLEDQLDFDGDFAMAYVLAHEWGHHIQNVVGTNARVQEATRGASQEEANELSVRVELQADCLAGVWAKDAFRDERLEAGDFDEAITAAEAVGDDRIQQKTQGRISPESFTHGTAEQRAQWFRTGFESGDRGSCDTFG